MDNLKSLQPLNLHNCSQEAIINYFQNSWELEETLLKSIKDSDTFYLNPDPLRNPLIFYLGHSAVFYINKLIDAGILSKRINPKYENIFEIGVDPETPEELNAAIAHIQWPDVEDVWQYRHKACEIILTAIAKIPLNLPIQQHHPLWALMMSIEHQRIHFETTSMLIRQVSVESLKRPSGWRYAPTYGNISGNEMIELIGGITELGKSEDSPIYGWDSEYGYCRVEVKPFAVSKYMITNGEFLEFVKVGGYENRGFWDEIAWNWKIQYNVKHPKFWLADRDCYKYRAMFDEIELPFDWPVEVNHHEAMAYCRWQGAKTRLMSEAEWNLATYGFVGHCQDCGQDTVDDYNLNLRFGSPCPVGMLKNSHYSSGICDLRGNVWEWLGENFKPLPGFKPHVLYKDNAVPFFDDRHKMLLGGAWATNGTEAMRFYRNWFRPYFYQHAGFRIVQDI
jgi:5-histidylcysteine sulfoxide synthase